MSLTLSTPDAVLYHLDLQDSPLTSEATEFLNECVGAAREAITDEAKLEANLPVPLPHSLHLLCRMLAARLYRRRDSIFGVEAYSLGGEAGAILATDPDMIKLFRPYRRGTVGVYVPDYLGGTS